MRTNSVVVLGSMILLAASCGGTSLEDVEEVQSSLTSYGNCGTFQDYEICVCSDVNGTGTCAVLTTLTRFYANVSTFPGLAPLNDTISSMKVGSKATGKVCADPAWGGNCGYLVAGATYSDLSFGSGCPGFVCNSFGQDYGFDCRCMNNNISSIRVDYNPRECQDPGPGQVTLFENSNYNNNMVGHPHNSLPDCVVISGGGTPQYPNPSANPTSGEIGGAFGLKNDTITSVKLGLNVQVQLFADPNFSPTVFQFNANTPTLPSSINDKTSSVKVGLF